MFRFRRFALELDCAVETIVWDIFIENWPVDVDEEGDLMWNGVAPEDDGHYYEHNDSFGFEPSGDF